jgi:hypothetical protein
MAENRKNRNNRSRNATEKAATGAGRGAETKAGLVIDAETGKADTPPPLDASTIPLSSAVDVRREQAKVYREARGGQMDKAEAAKLVWMLGEIRKSIELEDVERRLAELEDRTNGGKLPPTPDARATH